MTVTDDGVHWLENHLPCTVNPLEEYVEHYRYSMPLFESIDPNVHNDTIRSRERLFTLKIEGHDLAWLIRTLKEAEMHRELQKRYPGVAQAYAEYDVTARMASYYEDGKNY